MKGTHLFGAVALALMGAALLPAQDIASRANSNDSAKVTTTDKAEAPKAKKLSTAPEITIQHLRPQDKRGLNMFETPKRDTVPFDGFKLNWGAAFTQQFQNIGHSNTATPRVATGATVNQNQLMKVGAGFNNATANLYLNAQLAPGIRVALTSYLSSRHHQESWVKDGYLLIDASPIKIAAFENLMKYVTIRAGHFEVNYGDAHFRRSDNGNAIYNPLVGNYILDAFTTEIGGEVYFRTGSWLAMGGVTGGEIKGQVTVPEKRSPSYLGKLGYDRQLTNDLRVRLTGSTYVTRKSASNTLFSGDRAGSRYYMVVENTTATEKDQAWSGAIRPGMGSNVRAYVVNPFIKYRGLELFGNAEQVKGRSSNEVLNRTWKQYVAEGTYRFAADEQLYATTRYNWAKGELAGITGAVKANRFQAGGGWYMTPNVLLKGEWVKQGYSDFPVNDIRNGATFKGFVVEGVVAF